MTLRKRIDRLEGRNGCAFTATSLMLRQVFAPSASGPVLVAGLARRAGEPWRHIDHEPGEATEAFAVRLKLECAI
ncbi:MAG: hypothetical protein IKG52_04150 [Rhodobacteraceae bacterium]|nr:hypothetical protein [Paracoccaceae bacterium]